MSDAPLSDLILPHLKRDELAERMATFYTDVNAAIAAHGPTCWNRGECCSFDSFGHKLFVTSVELAYFARGQLQTWRSPRSDATCPYHENGRCTAREHRPLGCRIFFCDPSAKPWQGSEYERRLSELKQIGDALGVTYRYTEWLSALTALDQAISRPKNCTAGED